jgi:hypothetical protein
MFLLVDRRTQEIIQILLKTRRNKVFVDARVEKNLFCGRRVGAVVSNRGAVPLLPLQVRPAQPQPATAHRILKL